MQPLLNEPDARRGTRRETSRASVLLTGLALIAGVLVTAALVLWRAHGNELVQAGNHMLTISRLLTAHANSSIASVDLILGTLVPKVEEQLSSRAAGPDALRTQQGHSALQAYVAGIPELDALSVAGPDGQLVASSRSYPPPDINLGDREFFRLLSAEGARRTVVVGPLRNHVTGAWTLAIARRISTPAGAFWGTAVGLVKLDHFEKFYASLKLERGMWITFDTTDGVLLARHPHLDGVVGSKREVYRDGLRSGEGSVARGTGKVTGETRIVAFHKLENYPFLVAVRQTEYAALAEWRSQAALVGGLSMLAVGAISAAMLFLMRRFETVRQLGQARVERQEAVLARAAADAASAAKSQFLASMSHELRTPLNAVIGFAEVIGNEQFGPMTPPCYRDYAHDIHESGTHLLRLINNVLDFTRLEAGHLTLRAEEVDGAEQVAAALRMVAVQAEAAGIRLRNGTSGEQLSLWGDPGRVRQVLLNILWNAIKFTPRGGEVAIAATQEHGWLTIAIADSGIGIAAEDIPKVLDRFGQVDSSLGRRYEGAGLGLPLSRGLMELHGGTLDIESAPGVGTTVRLNFSALAAARMAA